MSAEDAVIEVYTEWCRMFQSLNVSGMKRLFDNHFEGLIYQPEEIGDAMFSWTEISAYWDAIPAIVESIPEWRELDRYVAIDRYSATVYTKLRTDIRIREAKRALVGDLRVTLGMRDTSDGWKIVSIHESRLVELTSLFE